MDNEKNEFSKYLKKRSSRHHYIPQFLVSGFTNTDGLLYLYDKQKDEIFKKPRSPKSVFFEIDRNTVSLDSTTESSIIEDLLYKEIDDKTSKIIKLYQELELSQIDFKLEDSATLLFFMISLFWRIPKSDYAANDLINRSTITANGNNAEILKKDPTYRKMARAGFFKHHIAEIKNFGSKGTKWLNIHQNANDIFLIGDYPILFKNERKLFSEFNDTDILMAVSSNRIYSSTVEKLTDFNNRNSLRYNVCIISQSVNYVACRNLEVLKHSVYKKLLEKGMMIGFEKEVFNTK
ncbi:MAG: hypothetical protein JWR61_2860 [Ferruginibacter sp.]|uniref:DUF4238 domain-containing protein n=1 Tax=Ferruginibacter sp. TaxID=1940288 RepID=UPI00265B5795|nr:DUF4238 domain-containing protein [Ferruginibacter sp.]MDB5277905.1 hypothetical protein [Ferruginibacter sp.]